MPKTCNHDNCTNPVFSKGLCMSHWRCSAFNKSNGTKTSVITKVPVKSVNKPIAKVSKNRYEALKKYRRLRDKYFQEHPVCEYPGCSSTKITLHHSRGRIGSFLTDKRFFKSLCMHHHEIVERQPLLAKQLGLSQSRLDK